MITKTFLFSLFFRKSEWREAQEFIFKVNEEQDKERTHNISRALREIVEQEEYKWQ